MPQVKRSALVMFSANQMYQLVNDVAMYPEFLPGCVASKVLESNADTMTAEVVVAKAGIRNSFTTHNQLLVGQSIKMTLADGPFKRLVGEWRFTALDSQACKVELELDFEFSNRLVAAAFGKVFQDLVGKMVQAFTDRAKQVY